MATEVGDQVGHALTLDDGRRLGYVDLGDPDGRPLIIFHGTPSSRLDAVWLDDAATRTGWRLVALDRPGHGRSDPAAHSRITDISEDVAALADHLDIDRFAVLGFSGGAPFALATASVLRSRVRLVGLVSGWGPPDRPGAYAGVTRTERWSDGLARRAPVVTRAMFTGIDAVIRLAPNASARLLTRRLTDDDSQASASPDVLASVRESLRQGSAGPAHDLHLIVSPWGFDLDTVEAPVWLWHGDHDPEIPLHHSEYIAGAVPDGHLEVIPGGDHFILYVHADEILGELARASDQLDDLVEGVAQAVDEPLRLGDGAGVGVDADVEVVDVREQREVGG
jgi:pimeloyl-ACP methyl ester carboxylesterase